MSTDPVAYLEAEFGRAEELARALPPGPWRWYKAEHDEYESLLGADDTYVLSSSDAEGYQSWVDKHPGFEAYLPLIGPVSMLRRVKADRAILAEHDNDGCSDSTVCARPSEEYNRSGDHFHEPLPWPCRTVRLLAEAWGWTGN